MSNFHVYAGANAARAHPTINRISVADLGDVLKAGWNDFMAMPTHLVFLTILYPLFGLALAMWTSGVGALPLVFPLASGFALVGPLAAIGLYEISRRREHGLDSTWMNALDVRHSPAMPSIVVLGIFLFILFGVWIGTARGLYISQFGEVAPESAGVFIRQLFTTPEGQTLMVAGNLIGLCFAIVVLATTVIAFPLLLDRDVGVVAAVSTSVRAVAANPVPMFAWGLIVALGLAIASVPFFVGLAIALPVFGHATWHLYRKVIAR